jgi:hypothetical protein
MTLSNYSNDFPIRSDRTDDENIERKEKKEMDSTGITPVMNMGGDGGFGLNGLGGIFALLVLLGLFNGGGFGFGGNGNTNALSADMQRGFDNQNTMAQTRDILGAVTSGTAQTIAASTANATNAINAIKDGNASLIREFGTVETALTGLSGKMQECCCEIKQQVMQNDYNGAIRDAATNANITAQIQGVKDMIAQNKIEALQAQVSQLQLQAATSNVLRFPNAWTYAGGVFPPVTSTPAA